MSSPQEVRNSITFHAVKTMDEVLEFGLRRPSAPAAVPNTRGAGRRPGARSNPPGKVIPLGPPRRRHRAALRPPISTDPLPIRSVDIPGRHGAARRMASTDVRLPEVAFLGRSNVGKSALLNRLVHRRALARVSRTPGRTQEINFFRINDLFVLVDLPGYGYARVSKERQAAWRPLIEGYLGNTATLRGAVQLLDVRHDPTNDDLAMLDFLAAIETPALVAVTKVDKLARQDRRGSRPRASPSHSRSTTAR